MSYNLFLLRMAEKPTHSVEAYIADNKSDLAQANLALHYDAQARGALVYKAACGDARQAEVIAVHGLVDRRIAAGVLPEKAQKPFLSRGVLFAAISPHYAGSSAIRGRTPEGCGGHKAVKNLEQPDKPARDPLFEYARTRIAHNDPIIHGLKLTRRLARTSEEGKPVVLTAYDHETGAIKVVAYSQRQKHNMVDVTPFDFHMPLDGQYDPTQVYADGVPDMNRGRLPDPIQEYLELYDTLLTGFPVSPAEQETQDPSAIMFTTELRDSKLWLPNTYERPNSGFRLTLYQDEQKTVSKADQNVALAQARFVLRNSINNEALPGTEFHSTRTAVIFTNNYDLSVQFASRFVQSAQELSEEDHKPSWFAHPDRQLIVGEIDHGKIKRIGEIDVRIQDGVVARFDQRRTITLKN